MEERNYLYDVFISYRWVTPDQEWVREQLYPALVRAGLKVYLDVENFIPGRDLILEMERAALQCRHVMCVLSPEYFEEGRMVEFESLLARRRDPSGRNSFLIPLVFRLTQVPERISGLIPIDWTNPENHVREWKKLLQVLGATNLDTSLPLPTKSLSFEAHTDVKAPHTPAAGINASPPTVRIYTLGPHDLGGLSWTTKYDEAKERWDTFWKNQSADQAGTGTTPADYLVRYQARHNAIPKITSARPPDEGRKSFTDRLSSNRVTRIEDLYTYRDKFEGFDEHGIAFKDIRQDQLSDYCPLVPQIRKS